MTYTDYYPNKRRHNTPSKADACMMRIAIEDRAKRLGVKVEFEIEPDHYGMDDDYFGEVVRNPKGVPYFDYIPMLDGRMGWSVKGYTCEYGDEYGYVPNDSWTFEDRRRYFHKLGMSKHEAWLQAKQQIADEAQQYVDTNVYMIHVQCGENHDYLGGMCATDEAEALTYYLLDYGNVIMGYLDEAEAEQEELALTTYAYAYA